ncbi:MAG: phenylalanine--tRNA ligase subunit alpha [Methanothrix sp.]|nr:phenylalanine--tRNA ligase subunit alpha [Methanothrix sp.]
MLSENDIRVLKAISDGDADPQIIAEKLGMKVEAVRASADALGEQDLIKVTKSVAEIISLTEEGTKYAKEGLPERNLLKSLGSGKPMFELKDPALKIGLGWLRKKDWATIQGGVIKPLGSATMGLDEVILQELLAGEMSSADLQKKSLDHLKSLIDPKSLDNLKSLIDPKSLDNLKSLVDPKSLDNLKSLVDPKSLDNLKSLVDPKSLDNLKSLVDPKSLDNLKSLVDPKGLADLKSRGLVDFSKGKKKWRYEITEVGKNYTSYGMDMILIHEMPPLTPDLIKNGQFSEKDGVLFMDYHGSSYRARPYDVTLAADRIIPGKKHPYQRLIDFMRAIMLEMGFVEIKGQIVQSSFWNFDALFQPQDHPAREMQDTFYLDSLADIPDYTRVKEMHECGGSGSAGWGGCWKPEVARQEVLRTHTTGVTIKYLAEHPEPPVKAFGIDRVYRREAIDATHTPEFEQLEGIVMDRDVTFSHLLGILKEFYAKMGFEEVRFRPGYFPYTEPSVEPEVFIDGLGWVELGGAGVFRKEVTAPFGIEHPVLAWGLGVSRVAMLKLGLKDLRLLYQSDIEWLRETPVCVKL